MTPKSQVPVAVSKIEEVERRQNTQENTLRNTQVYTLASSVPKGFLFYFHSSAFY